MTLIGRRKPASSAMPLSVSLAARPGGEALTRARPSSIGAEADEAGDLGIGRGDGGGVAARQREAPGHDPPRVDAVQCARDVDRCAPVGQLAGRSGSARAARRPTHQGGGGRRRGLPHLRRPMHARTRPGRPGGSARSRSPSPRTAHAPRRRLAGRERPRTARSPMRRWWSRARRGARREGYAFSGWPSEKWRPPARAASIAAHAPRAPQLRESPPGALRRSAASRPVGRSSTR